MSAEDYFYEHDDDGEQPSIVSCKFCGSDRVKWRLTNGGWRLFDTVREHPGNRMPEHNCRAKASPDDFEVVA